MNTNTDILAWVRHLAEEFVEREFPDEAPYFGIAWETFAEALQNTNCSGLKGLDIKDLREPTVRDLKRRTALERNSTIKAPQVIRAFHILCTTWQRIELDDSENRKQEMVQMLSQKFSLDFSLKIVDFFMENSDDQ